MKKVVVIGIVIVCIVLCAWFVGAKYTQDKLNRDENYEFLVEGERTQKEREDMKGEIIRNTIKEDLESRKEIEKVSISPESYEQSLKSGEIEVNVTLQEGYSMTQELEKEIQSYVMIAMNCKQVIVIEGIH